MQYHCFQGITFGVFSFRMGIALTIIMFFVHFQLRFMFRNMKNLQYTDPKDVQGKTKIVLMLHRDIM